jgi:photosystem II stability/assembly factor-like uncharacterized protein
MACNLLCLIKKIKGFMGMLNFLSRILLSVLLFTVAAQASETTKATNRIVTSDIVTIDRILNTQEFFVGGYRGFLGKVALTEGGAIFNAISAPLSLDVLVIKALSANEAIIGTSKGDIYTLTDGKLEHIETLSEYKDPILDMAVKDNEVWVVGPRGLIAKSLDKGKTWQKISVGEVTKSVTLTSNIPTTWFLGVSNMVADSFVFNATVNGKKVVADEDYYLDTDAGNIEIVNPLDPSSDLLLTFSYVPGPQFQAGDVSLNTVSYSGNTVLVAGEFGTAITLQKDGRWKSIYADLRQKETVMPYWIESSAREDRIVMVGAGGVATISQDGGNTWSQRNMDSNNGIFDVALTDEHAVIAAGAVGTVAKLNDKEWEITDRSGLDLVAWLKTVINLGGDSYLVAGGRGTLLLYKNKVWNKLVLRSIN